jgi:hypothetical protein
MGPAGLAFLIAAVGFAVLVAYGLSAKAPSGRGGGFQVPGVSQLGRLFQSPGPCRAKTYPPGAMYRFERCTGSTHPIGWPACSQVTYSVDARDAPPGYTSDVQQAIGQLSRASGLQMVEVSGSANISISWDPSLYNPVPGTSGEAGATDYGTESGLSGARARSATIRLSSHLHAGTAPSVGEEPILLHELGHAVGLGHYEGPVVMNPLDRGYPTFQPGDLAGLAVLYHPSTCAAGGAGAAGAAGG